jgi:hypothetical protein
VMKVWRAVLSSLSCRRSRGGWPAK